MSPKKLILDLCCQVLFFVVYVYITNDYYWFYNQRFIGVLIFLGYQWLVSPLIIGLSNTGNFAKLRQGLGFGALFLASFLTGIFLVNRENIPIANDSNRNNIFWILLFFGGFYSLLYFLGSLLDLFLVIRPQLKPKLFSKQNLLAKIDFAVQVILLILALLLLVVEPYPATIILFLASLWQFSWTSKFRDTHQDWHVHFGLSLANIVIFIVSQQIFMFCFVVIYLNYLRLLWGKIVS